MTDADVTHIASSAGGALRCGKLAPILHPATAFGAFARARKLHRRSGGHSQLTSIRDADYPRVPSERSRAWLSGDVAWSTPVQLFTVKLVTNGVTG